MITEDLLKEVEECDGFLSVHEDIKMVVITPHPLRAHRGGISHYTFECFTDKELDEIRELPNVLLVENSR